MDDYEFPESLLTNEIVTDEDIAGFIRDAETLLAEIEAETDNCELCTGLGLKVVDATKAGIAANKRWLEQRQAYRKTRQSDAHT